MTVQVHDSPAEVLVRQLYQAEPTPRIVDVPAITFLMIDGAGDPNSAPEYREAVAALYSLAYTLKFALKRTGTDYKVAPLEGLWWADEMAEFSINRKSGWRWTMMIGQPDAVTPALFGWAVEEVRRKKNLAGIKRVRLERFAEGRAAQILHRGPYAAEGPTIERLHAFIRERGYTFEGRQQKHHEIYLSDPTRTAPERLKTILRQAVV